MGGLGLQLLAVAVMLQAAPSGEAVMGPEAREVKAVLDNYTTACNRKDFDAISQIFAHDPDIVMVPTFIPQRCVGWQNVAEWFKVLFSSDDPFTMRHRNIQIKMFASGKAACLVCEQDGHGAYQGQPYAFEGVRTTWVFEKREGQWRVIHAHWSLPADFEPKQ